MPKILQHKLRTDTLSIWQDYYRLVKYAHVTVMMKEVKMRATHRSRNLLSKIYWHLIITIALAVKMVVLCFKTSFVWERTTSKYFHSGTTTCCSPDKRINWRWSLSIYFWTHICSNYNIPSNMSMLCCGFWQEICYLKWRVKSYME